MSLVERLYHNNINKKKLSEIKSVYFSSLYLLIYNNGDIKSRDGLKSLGKLLN